MRSIKGFFLFLFLVFPIASQELIGFDPKFHGWYWENFKLNPVPENVLKETFIGFSPDIDLGDFIFYEAICDFGENGHCLGVVLSAAIIFKENGLRGFCKPIYLYGTPNTSSSLNISSDLSSFLKLSFYLRYSNVKNRREVNSGILISGLLF